MRIGVLEWASCGGAEGVTQLPESIRLEGWAMCRALIESVAQAGHLPAACLTADAAARAHFPAHPDIYANVQLLDLNRHVRDQWREVYATCDATIVVAPESDGIQAELEAWCAVTGIRTCSSDGLFIEYAGDKWLTALRWQRNDIPQPETQLLSKWHGPAIDHRADTLWVVKSRDGAGCDGMQRLSSIELKEFQSRCGASDRWLVQPWLSGQAYSRAAIVDVAGQFYWLPVVSQILQTAPTVKYQGGCVLPDLVLSAAHAACLQRAILSLPGTACGWIGVDFLIDERGELIVIEVNPRLTTSFVGLSAACDVSLAEQIVRAKLAMPLSLPPSQKWGQVSFIV